MFGFIIRVGLVRELFLYKENEERWFTIKFLLILRLRSVMYVVEIMKTCKFVERLREKLKYSFNL